MNEKELERGLEEVRKAKIIHPEADGIQWTGDYVKVIYNIYPEGWETTPF